MQDSIETHQVLLSVAARIRRFGFIAALLHILVSFQNWNSFVSGERTGFVQPTQHEKTEAFCVDEVLWKRRETVGEYDWIRIRNDMILELSNVSY